MSWEDDGYKCRNCGSMMDNVATVGGCRGDDQSYWCEWCGASLNYYDANEPELDDWDFPIFLIRQKLEDLFRNHNYTHVETGMDSSFHTDFRELLNLYGVSVVTTLYTVFLEAKVRPDLFGVMLDEIADHENNWVRKEGYELAVKSLKHESVEIRDAAGQALGVLENPKAIPHLEEAIKREKYDMMKKDFQQIIEELKNE